MPNSIDRKLFAHINNDDSLEGTRNLQGHQMEIPLQFLQKFIDEKGEFLLKTLQDKQLDSKLTLFSKKLSSLLSSVNQFKSIKNHLQSLIDTAPATIRSIEKFIDKSLKEAVLPLVERVLNLDNIKKESVLIPGGWLGKPAGHAMVYEFQKDREGNLVFLIYNSGAGLNEFHKQISGLDKDRYETVKSFFIPKEAVTAENLKFFISELAKPKLCPILKNYKPETAITYDAVHLYKEVFQKMHFLHAKEIDSASLQSLGIEVHPSVAMGQRTGVCAYKALQELFKNIMSNPQNAKFSLIALKIYSIDLLVNKPDLCAKDVVLLDLAVQNLSRALLKNKDLPQSLVNQAHMLITKIEAFSKQKPAPKMHNQSLAGLIPEQKIAPLSMTNECSTPINPQQTKHTIIEQKFHKEERNFSKNAIDADHFSIEKLQEFNSSIQKLMREEAFKVAEEQIVSYLTSIPLTPSYFETLNTPQSVNIYIDNMRLLLIRYAQICKTNGNHSLNPERTVLMISVMEAMNLIFKHPSVSFFPGGIDALSRGIFDSFKKGSINNPYLSTEEPQLDKRLKEVFNNPTSRTKGAWEVGVDLNLEKIQNYLSKPENALLKTYLNKLFHDNKKNGLFTLFEIDQFSCQNRQEAIAYLHFLPFSQNPSFQTDAERAKLVRASIAFIDGMSTVMEKHSLAECNDANFCPKLDKKCVEVNPGSTMNGRPYMEEHILARSFHLNSEKTIAYFKKINNQYIAGSLIADFFQSWDKKTVNDLFAWPNGDKYKPGIENNALNQELKHLRIASSLQFLTSITYFNDHLDLFSGQTNGADFQSDIQQYLRRTIFQPGILIKTIKDNPDSLILFNRFIAKALVRFSLDLNSELYFYKLQVDVNSYILSIQDKELSLLKEGIKKEQQRIFEKIQHIQSTSLSPTDCYTAAKMSLQLYLDTLSGIENKNPEQAKKLFQLFIAFGNAGRSVALETQDERDAHQKLTDICLKTLMKNEDFIYKWALEMCPEILNKELTRKGSYPYFYGVDAQGKSVLSIDLTQGAIIVNGKSRCYPTRTMLNSSLCHEVLEGNSPEMSVSVCSDATSGLLFKEYDILGSATSERFFESIQFNKKAIDYELSELDDIEKYDENYKKVLNPTKVQPKTVYVTSNYSGNRYAVMDPNGVIKTGPLDELTRWDVKSHLKDEELKLAILQISSKRHHTHPFTPWIYQKEISVNKNKKFYEKQIITQSTNFSKISLSLKPGVHDTHSMSVTLPEYFHGKETSYWVSLDKTELFIEQGKKHYLLDAALGEIEELDEHNQSTGFILNHSKEQPLLTVFSKFEDPAFIQILVQKNTNNGLTAVKIHFPRYGLELEGHYNATTNQWSIHVKDKDQYVLLDDAQIITKPFMPNSLIFQKLGTAERIIYTPNQAFYVDLEAESKKNEDEFSTIYHQPLLDSSNTLVKEALKLENEQYLKRYPNGCATYSNSERYFVYSMDAKAQEAQTDSTEAQLYLVYLHLINLAPEAAFISLQNLMKTGGLKGTLNELETIHKIMESLPALNNEQMNGPAFIAVKTYLLYLCTELEAHKKSFTVPDSKALSADTPDDAIKKAHLEQMEQFKESLPKLALHYLEINNSTKNNIAGELHLSSDDAYQMMLRCRVATQGSIPLKAEMRVLKRRLLLSEQEQLKHQIQTNHKSSAKQQSRLNEIKKSLDKPLWESIPAQSIGPVTHEIPLKQPDSEFLSSHKQAIKNSDYNYFTDGDKAVLNIHPKISDYKFSHKFKAFYVVAQDPSHPLHDKLKDFFINRLKESRLLSEEEKNNSFIYTCAPTFLTVMNNAWAFKTMYLCKPFDFTLGEIFKKAYAINSKIDNTTIGMVTKPATINIAPLEKKDERYIRPEPLLVLKDEDFYSQYTVSSLFEKIGMEETAILLKTLQLDSEQAIKELKANLAAAIKNKHFSEAENLRNAADEAIGQIKNTDSYWFQTAMQHYVTDKVSMTDAIFVLSKAWSKELDEKSRDLLNSALLTANTGPKAADLKIQYSLERSGKIRKTLTLADLSRLFLLGDLNEYRKVTGLDDDKEIQSLHDTMARYFHCSILKTHYEKIKSLVDDLNTDPGNLVKIQKLGRELYVQNCASPQDTVLQFFQKEEGILIRPEQDFYLKKLIQKDETTNTYLNEVIQIGMGGGKSKVIGPLSALKKANGTNLVIQQVKSSLLEINYADACEKSQRLFNKKPFLLEFERHPISFQCTKGTLYSEQFESLYESLSQCIATKNYVITSGPNLQSLQLQYFDILRHKPSDVQSKEFQEWTKQVTWLRNILLLLKEKGDRLIDEVHDELDPTKKLNYIIGDPIGTSKEQIKFCTGFFFFLKQTNVSTILNTQAKISAFDLISDNTLISNPVTQLDQIMSAIANTLVQEDKQKENPLILILQKLSLNPEQKNELVQYLLNKDDKIKLVLEQKLQTKVIEAADLEALSFVKLQLSNILPFTLLETFNKDYGPSRLEGISELQKKLAIPYSAINTPNEQDRFGQFEVSLNLTMQLNIKEPLSRQLVIELIQSYLVQAREELSSATHGNLSHTIAGEEFNRLYGVHLSTDLSAIADMCKYQHDAFYAFVAKAQHLNDFKKAVLEEKIGPMVKLNPLVYSSNNHDLFEMTHTTQAMSGTPVNYRAYHQNLIFNELENLGTDGETKVLLKQKETKVLLSSHYNSAEEVLHDAMSNCAKAKDIRAIMDVGGLFKDESSNLVIAKNIAHYFKTHPQSTSKAIQFVLYFDTEKKELSALNVATHEVISLDNKTDEKDVFKKLHCSPDERFTFYDQARTTGTDLVQSTDAHALVTFSENTTQSSLLQGIKRLRQFTENQSVTLIEPSYLANRVAPSLDKVLHFVENNQKEQLCSQIHFPGVVEQFKTLVKSDLLTQLYVPEDPVLQNQLFQAFEDKFSEKSELNYFANFGAIDTPQRAAEYFQALSETYYNEWINFRMKANLEPSLAEKITIKKELDKRAVYGAKICNEWILSQKSGADLGLKVQVEAEQRVELKIELQTKLKNHVKTEDNIRDKKVNNEDKPFELNKLSTAPIQVKDYDSSLVLANGTLFPGIGFDSNLFISKLDAWTLLNGKNDETRFTEYHNGYTKPIHAVMMLASKENPDSTLQCVLLTRDEADLYTKLDKKALEQVYPNHYVWFASPSEAVPYEIPLYGSAPKKIPHHYDRLMEQIRFINGDIKDIAHQKDGVSWLNEDKDKKMEFLEKNVMPCFPEKNKFNNLLQARLKQLDTVGLEEKKVEQEFKQPSQASEACQLGTVVLHEKKVEQEFQEPRQIGEACQLDTVVLHEKKVEEVLQKPSQTGDAFEALSIKLNTEPKQSEMRSIPVRETKAKKPPVSLSSSRDTLFSLHSDVKPKKSRAKRCCVLQ